MTIRSGSATGTRTSTTSRREASPWIPTETCGSPTRSTAACFASRPVRPRPISCWASRISLPRAACRMGRSTACARRRWHGCIRRRASSTFWTSFRRRSSCGCWCSRRRSPMGWPPRARSCRSQDGPFTNWDAWDGMGTYRFQCTGFIFNPYKVGPYADGEIWLNEHSSNRALLIADDGAIVAVVGAQNQYLRGGDSVYYAGCGIHLRGESSLVARRLPRHRPSVTTSTSQTSSSRPCTATPCRISPTRRGRAFACRTPTGCSFRRGRTNSRTTALASPSDWRCTATSSSCATRV